MVDLSSKTVLITGAAGRIGSEAARKIAAAGANIILCDIDCDHVEKLGKELDSMYRDKIITIATDITEGEKIDKLISQSLEKVGRVTTAIHCAYPTSAGWGTCIEKLKAEYLQEDLIMQLGSAILFSQKILEYFRYNGGGDLIHISSIQGVCAPKFDHYHGTSMYSPVEYSAIKAGVIAITRWLAKYYADMKIRVNCVSPGGIFDKQPEVFVDRYRSDCTNIGMLDASHVADTILFLMSPQSVAINGQNLVVDDGWSL